MAHLAQIILVDDHPMFREGMKLLIEMEGIGEVVAEADNGQMLLDLLEVITPDLVILDVQMPVMNGLEASKRAMLKNPGLKILVLTMTYGNEVFTALKQAGVMGFVLKNSGKQILEQAIKTLIRGKKFFSLEYPEIRVKILQGQTLIT